jgi:hypothetical protein
MTMNGMMDGMMAWLMGIGPAGWVLLIALLVTIVFVLVGRSAGGEGTGSSRPK